MHSIGKYRTGCTYGHACKNKHERPSTEPAENMIPVSVNAAAVIPHTNGGKQVLTEIQQQDVKDKNFTILPNDTEYWMNSNKIWMEPKDDADSLCSNCNESHATITPCLDGQNHSMLLHQMAVDMATSAVERDKPCRWMSYETQKKIASNTELPMATRQRCNTIVVERPATRPKGDIRFCYNLKAKTMEDEILYDSD